MNSDRMASVSVFWWLYLHSINHKKQKTIRDVSHVSGRKGNHTFDGKSFARAWMTKVCNLRSVTAQE